MPRFRAVLVVVLGCSVSALSAAELTLVRDADGVTVLCDGKPFTRYVAKSGTKPILWPIVGPTGKEMTRGYPMRDPQGPEKKDHVHHRSLWFVHGDVNGISFWDELAQNHGQVDHEEYLELTNGNPARLRTRNAWRMPDGHVVCEDQRTMGFGADANTRWIDFRVTLTAKDDKVVLGDTKEGSLGMRVGGAMAVDDKAGGVITNSDGLHDADAWGKRASWVDYSGPIDGEQVGITILNHPDSFRYPTYWHVRTYGLFAANPFGLHDFVGKPEANGQLTLSRGESFSLYYRIIFHAGNVDVAGTVAAFDRYAAESVQD
jgi:hypothetical protein